MIRFPAGNLHQGELGLEHVNELIEMRHGNIVALAWNTSSHLEVSFYFAFGRKLNIFLLSTHSEVITKYFYEVEVFAIGYII